MKATGKVEHELIAANVRELVLIVGSDGVMVPFRPKTGSPQGPAAWHEVKVAALAQLGQRTGRDAPERGRYQQPALASPRLGQRLLRSAL